MKSCEALLAGGMKGLEITFTLPKADEVIAEIVAKNEDPEVVVGAGTVLDAITLFPWRLWRERNSS